MINSTFLQTKNNNMNNSTTTTFKKFLLSAVLSIICVAGLLLNSAVAQTVLISPSGDGGFENGPTFEANGWSVINSTPLGTAGTPGANTWHVGNAASSSAGTSAAYVSSTGGATWSYNTASPTTSSFYRTVTSTIASESIIALNFQWKGSGESGYDRLLVYAVPDGSLLPGPNNPLSPSTIMQGPVAGYTLIYTQSNYAQATYTQASAIVPSSFVGTSFKLYFVFQGDNSFGTSPGAAVDEISLIASEPATYSASALGGMWSSPATWVGNAVPPSGNDIVIPEGVQVTVDGNVSPRNLTVNGTLRYATILAPVLSIAQNMTIGTTGRFIGHTPANVFVSLNLYGNFTNNGYADLKYTGINLYSLTGTTIDGSGYFEGGDTRGIVRAITIYSPATHTLNTNQSLTISSQFTPLVGTFNTNGKLKLDNTVGITGLDYNQKVQDVVLNNMGSGYTVAPVVFSTAVVQIVTGNAAVSGTRYIYGENVYVATGAGTFNDSLPTSTGDVAFTTSGPSLIWVGTNGNIGTNLPYNSTLSLATQYFVGNNLYVATTATGVTTFPTHTSGLVGNLLYVGAAPKVSVNFDATTGTVRGLNLVNAGSGINAAPAGLVFSVGNANGLGSGASASVLYHARVLGTANTLVQKNGEAAVTGGLDINSDQGVSLATSHPQGASGIGRVSVLTGGQYTVAPMIGFTPPLALNLVSNPGSGYVVAPTVIVSGGTLISGTALTTSSFTITLNQGKIVSVYLNSAATTATTAPKYSVLPTLTLSGGNATLEWPAGCLPTANVILGSNGSIKDIVVTNPGYGYWINPNAAFGATSGTAAGGTFTNAASVPTANVALYNYTMSYFTPATSSPTNVDDALIPVNRKLNNLTLSGNGNGLTLTNNLTLFGTAPITLNASLNSPGNILDLGGYNLNCTYYLYSGSAFTSRFNSSTGTCYVKNGSMTLNGRGGGTTGSTFNFLFDMPLTVASGTGTGPANGSDITSVTASQVSVSNDVAGGTGLALGTRAYKVENKTTLGGPGVSGTGPSVSLRYANLDSLTTPQASTVLVQSSSNNGAWTQVTAPYGASGSLPTVALTYGNYGILSSNSTAPGPISLSATNYFAWGTQAPTITGVNPTTVCAFNDEITITGIGLTGVTAVTIGGTPVTSFTVVSATQIKCFSAAGTSGVVGVTKYGATSYGTDVITINSGPASPALNTTAVSGEYGQPVTISVVAPLAGTTYNWYTTPNGTFAAYTDSVITAPACTNYYVTAGTGACESQRTVVTTTVTYPLLVSSEEVFCGTGGGVSLTAAPLNAAATLTWTSLTPSAVLSSTTANPTSTTTSETSDFMLTVSAAGCPDYTLYKSIGLYPLPTANVTSSASGVCPGTSATINSGLSAGNFTVAPITVTMTPVPSNATTLVENGVASIPQSSGTLDDGGWGGIPIGFTFNYFGTDRTTINVGTNMTMHLGTYSAAALGDFSFTTFPSLSEPASVIAASAHDINFAASTGALSGSIKYWTQGYAPNRRFIVQYENARAFNSSGATAKYTTAQVHFLETLGTVEIHIPLSQNSGTYNKVVGLQDETRTIGAVAIATTATITDQAWRFSPPSNYTTIWTANGDQIASGTNIFTQTVSPASTTLYDISYTNQTTGCASEPNSAQVNMLVLTPTPVTGVTTTSTVSQVCAGSTVPLAHDYTVSSAGLTYNWQTSIDAGTTWVDVVGATAATYSVIQNAASSYRVGISSCGGDTTYAAPVAIAMSSFVDCYCTPSGGSIADEEITNVTISTLNNSSTCTDLAPGAGSIVSVYGNYSGLPATNLYQNVPVSGSLTINSCGTSNFSSGAAIFIDYNHNGSFSDLGERVWSNGSSANIACVPASIVPVSFTAPISSLPGLTRMRIINSESVSGDQINPCVTPFYGEIEDYIVNVVGPPDAPATPIATAFGNCISGDTITMVGTAPEGVAYYWQTTANGTSFDNSASTWVVNGNGTYYIRAYASMGGQWSTASAITLSAFPLVTPPTAITNLSGTPYCAAVTLQSGTAPLGITYYWQGTNPTGTSIALPAALNSTATASGTYFIAARNDTTLCWSAASSINVVVYPSPTGTALASSPASCASLDGSVLFSVSGAGTVFSSDFSSTTLPAGATLAGNDAGITTNGLLRLTSAANSKNGGILIENLSGVSANDYQVDFDFITTSSGTTTPADGLSYSYGPDVVGIPTGLGSTVVGTPVAPGATNVENGSGSALKLAFDAYTNGENQEGVYLMYNTPIWNQTPTSAGVLNYSNNVAWRATASAGASTHVTIKVNSLGQVSMWLNGVVAVSNQQLPPSYLSDDKSTWKHVLSARTGGLNQGHFIDNLTIQYNMFEYSLTDTTWTSINPISAAPGTYNASVRYAGVGGCVVSLGSVTIAPFSMNSVSISRADSLACSGEVMTVIGSVIGQAAGLTYQWQISTDNGTTWGNIAGATNINVSNPQTEASLYRLGVSYCGGEYAYTSSVSIAMDNIQNCFCIPAPTFGTSDGDLISLVSIVGTTLNNNTGFANGTPAYMFYNSLPNHTATLMPSTTYAMSVATGEWGNQGMAAWIDYNDDGVFSATERIGATATTIGTGFTPGAVNATGSFTISLACTPPVGEHRMRVRTVYGTAGVLLSPCTNYQWGETEDYTITIAPAPVCPSAGLLSANLDTPPASTSSDFSWEQGCSSATSYDIEYGPIGFTLGSGTLVANQTVTITGTLASYTLQGLAPASTYDVYVRAHCDSVNFSAWSNVIAASTASSGPATSPQTLCEGATVANLVATGSEGSYIFWYASATATAWLSTTEVLISGTYYATQVVGGIESSDRTATVVTILPNTSVTTPVTTCGTYTWADNGQTYTASGIYSGSVINCVTQILDLTITPLAIPTIAVSSEPAGPVCAGTSVTFTATTANAGVSPSSCDYTFNLLDSWGDGWNGNTMSVLQGSTVVATLSFAADVDCDPCTATSLSQTVSLQSGQTYTLFWNPTPTWFTYPEEVGVNVVNPSGTTIYSMPFFSQALKGTTLTTINANCSSSTIAWQVNGVAVAGANASTYTTSSLNPGDVVTASITANSACVSSTAVVSSPSTLVVNPLTTPTVVVTSSSSSVCQGTAVTFTAAGSPANVAVAASCNYTFNKLDSYGDGWNGAQMRVMNGTTIVATLGLASGGFAAQTVSLQSGISYSLVWNSAGSYPEEVGVQVVNSSGVTVYSMGYDSEASAGTTLATIAADCPSVSPYQWSLNGSPIAGATSATYTSSALSSTDVVTVSYTTNAPCTSTAPAVSSGVSVNVIANIVNTTTASAYVSYSWNGQTYTASGVYTGATTNCVTEQLNLTILSMPLVTFQVDMAQSNAPAGAIPFVNGTFNGWCGNCNPMTNIGGSVWSLTIPLMPQTYEYKFTYNGWDGQENLLAGTSCTVTNFGFTNRFLVLGTTDVVLPLVCWNQCSACVTQAPVTFRVDMSQSGAPAGSIPEVNGTFNGWCGNCNPMTDANGDGVWETTILLAEGPYEYKFSYSNWSGQEALTPGSSCTLTSGQYTNRTLAVAGSQAMVLPVVCWNSCSACVVSATLSLNVLLDGYYVLGSSPAEMRAARYTNLAESGSSTPGAVTDVDVITVELRSAANLNTVVYSVSPILQTNGSVQCVFPASAIGGSYYVVVKHRSANPLWSASPIAISASTALNFATNAIISYSDESPTSQFYVSPVHEIASGLYGMWLGELNDDEFLDSQDFPAFDADVYSSAYLGTYMLDGDLNGDAYVDATDYAVFDFNSRQGAYLQRPY
jgi:hypothetical protein